MIGVGAGFKAEVNLLALMGKRAALRASTLRARPLEEKARHRAGDGAPRAAAVRARRGCACRSPRPSPLDEAAAAYERFAAGGKLGKVVLLH